MDSFSLIKPEGGNRNEHLGLAAGVKVLDLTKADRGQSPGPGSFLAFLLSFSLVGTYAL